MLVLALLLLTLVPFHVHLHHDSLSPDDPVAAHDHVSDIHILTLSDGSDHHEAGHTLEPTPHIVLKQVGMHLPAFAMLLVLSMLLPVIGGSAVKPAAVTARRLHRLNHHTTPPLRAPPRD